MQVFISRKLNLSRLNSFSLSAFVWSKSFHLVVLSCQCSSIQFFFMWFNQFCSIQFHSIQPFIRIRLVFDGAAHHFASVKLDLTTPKPRAGTIGIICMSTCQSVPFNHIQATNYIKYRLWRDIHIQCDHGISDKYSHQYHTINGIST